MKHRVIVILFGIVSCYGMTPAEFDDIRFQAHIANLTPKNLAVYISEKGGIQSLSAGTLEAFIRKKGGYVGLNCDELNQVNLRKFMLHPEWQKPFSDARTQRLRREKEKKLAPMKLWTKMQVIEYVESKTDEKLDCDELNILNDILEASDQAALSTSNRKTESFELKDQTGLTASKKKLLQEKFVKFKTGTVRWPDVDFSIMPEEELETYTTSFMITTVEAEFIAHRQRELSELKSIDEWDRERAMLFIQNLLNKESLNYEQWKKISCKVRLPLIQLKPLIKPMSKTVYEELLQGHNKELEELQQIGAQKNNSQSELDDTAA